MFPALILTGIGGKPEELLNLDLVRRDAPLLVKRFSGGGTVVIDHTSLVSIYKESSQRFWLPFLANPRLAVRNGFILTVLSCLFVLVCCSSQHLLEEQRIFPTSSHILEVSCNGPLTLFSALSLTL